MTLTRDINEAIIGLRRLAKSAKELGVEDVTQDNGIRVIQILAELNLVALPGRCGNDATKKNSNIEFEIKTANMTKVSNFGTSHHLTESVLARYKKVPWIFGFYEDIVLKEIYVVSRHNMLTYYKRWGEALKIKSHLNNPKINFSFVKKNGALILRKN